MARVGGRIALSLSTPMIRRWQVHRGPSLADDPALLAIAQRLDQTKVLSAYLVAPGRADAVGAYGIGVGGASRRAADGGNLRRRLC